MNFDEIKEGKTYYTLTQSIYGRKIETLVAKKKLYSMQAIIFIDEKKRERKVYNESLKNILSYHDAHAIYDNISNERLYLFNFLDAIKAIP